MTQKPETSSLSRIKYYVERGEVREGFHRYVRMKHLAGLNHVLDRRALRRDLEWAQAQTAGHHPTIALPMRTRLELPIDSEVGHLIYRGRFELDELAFLRSFLRPGDVVVDVGANLGIFTVLAAACVGESGQVIAFEPNPTVFSRLRRNVALNNGMPQATLENCGLSDSAGHMKMRVPQAGLDGWSSFGQPSVDAECRLVETPVTTWDDYAGEQARDLERIAFVKLDVEGWESRVLAGARRILESDHPPVLQVEFSEQAASSAGSSCAEVVTLLETHGFSLWRFMRLDRHLAPFMPTRHGYEGNALAIRDLRPVRQRLHTDSLMWRLHRPGFGIY